MPWRPCSERMLTELLRHDPHPKVYPTPLMRPDLQLVCVVRDLERSPVVGSYADYGHLTAEKLASGYPNQLRCLFFIVPDEVYKQVIEPEP